MKNTMRKQMLEKRKKMKKEAVFRKSNAIQDKFLKSGYFRSAKSMLVYMPINNEVLTEKIINKALELGKMVALPVVEGDVLVLSELKSINKVKKGKFSVLEPETRRIISPKKIDTVVMPGIAFDEDGNRIGYGKGYYDKLLAGIGAKKIALAFDFQIAKKILKEHNDIPMDVIITEKRTGERT